MRESETKMNGKQLESLLGATIKEIVTNDDDGFSINGIIVKTEAGRTLTLWVLRDPEANGPGWIDITEQGA